MAANVTNRLPAPPADLAGRKLPLKRISGTVFRIHRTDRPCVHFGRNLSGRFDDPLKQYGVLYAALRPEAAFAEVFLRQLFLMVIRELDVLERAISEIACRKLRCVDLTGAGLRRLSCDNRLATEKPYDTVGQWSRAFYEHPQQPDGILYRSRHNPRFNCLAIFDRCRSKLELGVSEELFSASRHAWTLGQIARYRLALEPNPKTP